MEDFSAGKRNAAPGFLIEAAVFFRLRKYFFDGPGSSGKLRIAAGESRVPIAVLRFRVGAPAAT